MRGHFSRLEHQSQAYFNRRAPHVLSALTLYLPSGIRDTYYYDLIGNVSTSKLRTAPPVPKNRQGTQFSILELRPRYPLLGGWNYSFTLGWDSPLENSASYDKSTDRYIVEVPIMTPVVGAVINEEVLKVILPEGATWVQFLFLCGLASVWSNLHIPGTSNSPLHSLPFRTQRLTISHTLIQLVAQY